jgi:hypothetical protein
MVVMLDMLDDSVEDIFPKQVEAMQIAQNVPKKFPTD